MKQKLSYASKSLVFIVGAGDN